MLGGQKQKHFSPLGNELYFDANLAEKFLLYSPPKWPPCHVVANQEYHQKGGYMYMTPKISSAKSFITHVHLQELPGRIFLTQKLIIELFLLTFKSTLLLAAARKNNFPGACLDESCSCIEVPDTFPSNWNTLN